MLIVKKFGGSSVADKDRILSLIHIQMCIRDRHLIDYETGKITLDGKEYELLDHYFPTIDPKDPYALTEEEEDIMERLACAFLNCEKLQKHMRFLLNKGSLYKVYNNNLL